MKFGILYIPDYYPERHKSSSHYYGEMTEQIQLCEEIGIDGIWFAEHYVGGYAFPSPPIFAAALAQKTKRIRFGTGVTLLPLTNPIKTAEEYAMLDVLSGGRFDFGIGRGILRDEYDLFGIDGNQSQGRYHEALDVILQAWTRDEVNFDGKHFKVNHVKALPKPVQQPHPPIWAAAVASPESFIWTGQRNFNIMLVPFAYSSFGPLRERVELYRKALLESGHDPARREIQGTYHLYCAEDDAQARREAAPELDRYLKFFISLDKPWQSADYKAYGKGLGEIFEQLNYDVMDRGDGMIFGSPERCVQRIKNIKQGLGLTYMLFEVNFGGMAHDKVMKSLERFGKSVLPDVRNV
jgi:alkanesulfonate monooxygenase SsuD/methylene tetrahydromethanopterin reductase-like flavin-dependent oxidoreductase (luciferase family)